MSIGLTKRDIATIQGIFRNHPEVTLVYTFGSRAKGTYKTGSDIDLAVMNSGVSFDAICAIKGELEESSLPYSVDVVNYPELQNEELKEHIDRVGVEFYKR